jgi:DNA-binding transcriptional ArsR family regulator
VLIPAIILYMRCAADVRVDAIFRTLADATRRSVVQQLGKGGPQTVGALAASFDVALPSFMEHVGVLERCGVVRSAKKGRVRTVTLQPDSLRAATGWLEGQRALWERRLDQLDDYLKETT